MSAVRQVSPFDRILYLKSLPQVGRLSNAQVARLAFEAVEAHLEPGAVLFSPDTTDPDLFILISGSVRVERPGGNYWVAQPGDTVGFVSMLAGRARARAVAETEVIALRLPLTRVLELLEEDFGALQNAVRNLARAQLRLLTRAIGGTHRAPWTDVPELPEGRELDLLERLNLLRKGDLFVEVGLEAGVMLATSMKSQRWRAGSVLWKPGDLSGPMWIIAQGEVEATLENGEKFTAGPGYPLGNIESLAQKPRWYRPVAVTDLLTLRVDHETFFDVMEDDFGVAEAFQSAMANGILNTIEALIEKGEELGPLDPS